jgi:transposase
VISAELLLLYMKGPSIEQNFGFLKDPLIVNALFLKPPQPIEALGLILMLVSMVWRLMERTIRMSLRQSDRRSRDGTRSPLLCPHCSR